FLLDEPTRGIDVGAKAEVYNLIGELAKQGTGFLLVSSELPELLAVSDRIYVLCDGRLTAELARGEFDQTAIMEAATRCTHGNHDEQPGKRGQSTVGTTITTSGGSALSQARRTFRQGLGFILRFQSFFGLIIVFVLAVIYSPIRNDTNIFLSERNLSNVARDVAETGILATGQLLVILIGGIDLSVGSVVALTATGTAFLLMRQSSITLPLLGTIDVSPMP